MVACEGSGPVPTMYVISDSVGITAHALARAAASQFGVTDPAIKVLPNVKAFAEAQEFLEQAQADQAEESGGGEPVVVLFYTLVEGDLYDQLQDYLHAHPCIAGVDLMTPALHAIQRASGLVPAREPGEQRATDAAYYRRIDAIEFTIAHDDGRNPQDLTKADIVLLGVSRSSKTPTSIYIAQEGFKVANVPLDLYTDPPAQLFDVDPTRLFGLVTTPDVLVGIRRRRLGNALGIAADYADPESISRDLDDARALMRRLGAIVIRTDNRAVEETAREVLRYYEMAHPRASVGPRLGE